MDESEKKGLERRAGRGLNVKGVRRQKLRDPGRTLGQEVTQPAGSR